MRAVSGNKPISVDITHSLQFRKDGSEYSDGRRRQILELGKAVVALGIDALFIESHPKPEQALCDGASALPSNLIYPFLKQIGEIDALVKRQPQIDIN